VLWKRLVPWKRIQNIIRKFYAFRCREIKKIKITVISWLHLYIYININYIITKLY